MSTSACAQREPARVDASKYDAFWLWAGVEPQAVLDDAQTVYILQGQIDPAAKDGPAKHITAQGIAPATLDTPEVWLVYRAHTLRWSPGIHAAIMRRIRLWEHAGTNIAGVQIDFDSETRHLDRYASFLREFRERLPVSQKLGITGLLDWSAQGDSRALNGLAGTVDEIVLQTYQGRTTIAGYEDYLRSLDPLDMPFKIGLVQGGEWDAPDSLDAHPHFRGYVVFLVNQ